ncbi:hypothetical protein U1Q18_024248 [Sarracenia purpurea var. burkii]
MEALRSKAKEPCNVQEDEGSVHIEGWRKSNLEDRALKECSEALEEADYVKDLSKHQAAITEGIIDRMTLGRATAKCCGFHASLLLQSRGGWLLFGWIDQLLPSFSPIAASWSIIGYRTSEVSPFHGSQPKLMDDLEHLVGFADWGMVKVCVDRFISGRDIIAVELCLFFLFECACLPLLLLIFGSGLAYAGSAASMCRWLFCLGRCLPVLVFPKGSPMLPDIAEALLKVSETGELRALENKMLRSEKCVEEESESDSESELGDASLGLNSFWILFLLSGGTSTVALGIYVIPSMGKLILGTLRQWGKQRRRRFSRRDSDGEIPTNPSNPSPPSTQALENL